MGKVKLKHKLFEAADRVWKASQKYGPVDDGRPEGDEFDDALLNLRVVSKAFEQLVRAERKALVEIVNALDFADGNVSHKVREAIERGRTAIQESEIIVEAIEDTQGKG
jgi:hypothetical protein